MNAQDSRQTVERAGDDPTTAVYGVHAVRPTEIAVTALICRTLPAAQEYAAGLSTDPGVLAAGVTRYRLDTPGERSPIALFVAGVRQDVPYISNDRRVHANGREQQPPDSRPALPGSGRTAVTS